jgi:uncharacterized membrane protein
MKPLVTIGRTCYAIGLAGLGLQQFFYPGFRPVFAPYVLEYGPFWQTMVYLSSLALLFFAASIIFNFRGRDITLICGGVFLLDLLLLHVPTRLMNNPTSLGFWTDALKILAFAGGAFVIAGTFSMDEKKMEERMSIMKFLERFVPLGGILFATMLTIFGIDHFLYADFVASLVPKWIPGDFFWAYFSGVALIGAGVALMMRFKQKLIGLLTGLMLFIWFLILHIPRAITMPDLMNGNEITSVFQALAFSGVAFVLAFEPQYQVKKYPSPSFR